MRFDLAIINEHQQILLIASIFSFFLVFMAKVVVISFFSVFDIRLELKLVCFSLIVFRFSFFNIRIRADYRTLAYEILF